MTTQCLRLLPLLFAALLATGVAAQTPDSGIDAVSPQGSPTDIGGPTPEDAPPIPSFQKQSGSQAGGPANALNTQDQRARESLPDGSVAEVVTGRNLYHGNYCGPGDRGLDADGQARAPVDALDAACQRHDACYDEARSRSCGCDRTLKRDALRLADDPNLSRVLRARAASVIEGMDVLACSEP
ncbi:hypothetical protein [Methylobacterium planeticum]|uniref:Phospholipase A2-like domain-containing protein n=1 Tax=Methylobacterium planeticum TaxID=2615211 RepID=A0A6N6N0X0_9HYPH|nr:hypothetical protein [Methylobacterium planeticum]KAB1076162.1 hypothetical protein F6X51_01065 [Methylobacterium planeticum]